MGKFLLGFAVGAACGAVAVVLLSRQDDGVYAVGAQRSLGDIVAGALEAGRRATAEHERQSWIDYRARLPQPGADRAAGFDSGVSI